MTMQDVAQALQRASSALERRPDMGLHDDAPATARWQRGTRVVSSHANGTAVESDMPQELGGTGDRITPGWLFRAGIAACATTSIALRAASEGIELTSLEVQVGSRSDTRGLLGLRDARGELVYAGPGDVTLRVRLSGNASAQRLRELVEDGCRCSPIPNAVRAPIDYALEIEVTD
jgi:organic hydroperoxide reductase OsmC/OhrA